MTQTNKHLLRANHVAHAYGEDVWNVLYGNKKFYIVGLNKNTSKWLSLHLFSQNSHPVIIVPNPSENPKINCKQTKSCTMLTSF